MTHQRAEFVVRLTVMEGLLSHLQLLAELVATMLLVTHLVVCMLV